MTCLTFEVAIAVCAALISSLAALAPFIPLMELWWDWLAWTVAAVVVLMADAWLGLTLMIAALYAWLVLGAFDAKHRLRDRI